MMDERLQEAISQHGQKVDWQKGDVISPTKLMIKGSKNSRTSSDEVVVNVK
jgi:hypothetical protein